MVSSVNLELREQDAPREDIVETQPLLSQITAEVLHPRSIAETDEYRQADQQRHTNPHAAHDRRLLDGRRRHSSIDENVDNDADDRHRDRHDQPIPNGRINSSTHGHLSGSPTESLFLK